MQYGGVTAGALPAGDPTGRKTPMFLDTDGATLYYEVRGTGPLLLVSQSGEGDAGRSADLVDRLTDRYTVVTYDRRGLSRSTCAASGRSVTMEQHADDAYRLLTELTDEPALILGCSMGAAIGLHLAVAHPGRLRTLVAHDPVSPSLLPAGPRAGHAAELARLQEVYRQGGLRAALPEIARVLGIDPARQETEPDLTPMPLTPERAANFGFFIARDFTAVIEAELDTEALRTSPVRIVAAGGATTAPHAFVGQCAHRLARLAGRKVVTFPGGHNGNTTHPRAYAARLREVLA
ncbi:MULTISPECIES: alpha/beta fold hydrolase [unclassified Streptomyces]|uniref:alpha/beta fold hydrolase n=1 Tax=unclassified Streptomyces TaxID=2593676 RepID=UPI00093BF7F9|nr:alpha/beta hydrolase [Streptomyces sp. CB01249]OKI94962.1 hydrolase [Streptomyces sp. CB01249]